MPDSTADRPPRNAQSAGDRRGVLGTERTAAAAPGFGFGDLTCRLSKGRYIRSPPGFGSARQLGELVVMTIRRGATRRPGLSLYRSHVEKRSYMCAGTFWS